MVAALRRDGNLRRRPGPRSNSGGAAGGGKVTPDMDSHVAGNPGAAAAVGDPRVELASRRTGMAFQRTRLAADRTLMAVIRTSLSLIGFGFTIVQFFERFQGMPDVSPAMRPQVPRYLGLALIAAGVVGLLVSLWQYHTTLQYLERDFEPIARARVPLLQRGVKGPLVEYADSGHRLILYRQQGYDTP